MWRDQLPSLKLLLNIVKDLIISVNERSFVLRFPHPSWPNLHNLSGSCSQILSVRWKCKRTYRCISKWKSLNQFGPLSVDFPHEHFAWDTDTAMKRFMSNVNQSECISLSLVIGLPGKKRAAAASLMPIQTSNRVMCFYQFHHSCRISRFPDLQVYSFRFISIKKEISSFTFTVWSLEQEASSLNVLFHRSALTLS